MEIVSELFAGIPEVWLVIPEGNGKTTLMSGVALYYADFTPDAMIPIAASSRDQAKWLFRQAAGFVTRSGIGGRKAQPKGKRFRIFDGYRCINALLSGGVIQVFAADEGTGDGAIPNGVAIVDELHRHRDLGLYETWAGKLDKCDAQLCALSTAGEPGTPFEITRERIHKEATSRRETLGHVRAATEEVVLHDYRLPKDASPNDMEAVKAANPLAKITEQRLTRKRRKPTMTETRWRRFVCNLATRSDSAAISEAEWDARVTGETIPVGEPVWAGADFGWKWDTTAIVPLYMPSAETRVFGKAQIVVPPRDMSSTRPEEVHEAFLAIHHVNPIHTVVMDENAGGAQMCGWIEDKLGARVVAHSQADVAMALAYSRWMEGMRLGWHAYPDDPEFRQHALNAIARLISQDRTRFDRPRGARNASSNTQERRVWDALTAASMVHSVAVGELEIEELPFDPEDYRIEQL